MAVQHWQNGQDLAEFFAPVLERIADEQQRRLALEVLEWVHNAYPQLDIRIAWNQPIFTHHGTFIIGFSYAKHHMAVSPEQAGIAKFAADFDKAKLSHTTMLVRVPWPSAKTITQAHCDDMAVELIGKMIEFNIKDKEGYSNFWR
ncbi:iron chaperone [Corynebacterium sp. sy017]|uniref:iron chaperone n=1 Tax=unclassified Corynebacterium TaxID=2624378 RepID=UPI001184B9B4|nr:MULTISPECIES: DUF1801 domain-containing protein [unclassified Corynebacterium]MBP3087751.1 iron chaperone [Corynebacterium sp. sy017]QDZ42726.1 iron chaperone [Corynebacterium sp. sy039]TSD92301.1 iron chaperone [Corynebacterium sp. SY003]